MKVEVKKIDATKRELRFEVPRERVTQTLDEIYQEIAKVAKIKGYRPGKAPRHLVEAEHGRVAREEALKKIIPEVYQEGLEKEKIAPLDMPEIFDVNFKDGMITFTAKLDIRPDFEVKNYKGVKVKRKDSQVTEEELNKTLDFIKKGHGKEGQELTIDDAFAKSHGFPGLEEFKNSLKRQMEMDKDRQNRLDLENQIVDEVIKHVKFTPPTSLVAKQLEHRLNETKRRFKSQGMPDADFAKREEEIRKELQPLVERDVKVYIVFEKIGELEGITVNENESMAAKVMELLLKEAKWE